MPSSAAEKAGAKSSGLLRVIAILSVLIVSAFLYFASFRPESDASIAIDASQTGYPISRTFLGLSHDWSEAKDMMGIPATGTNPIYRQLVRNLYANGGGPVVIRIGGSSTDLSEFNGEPNASEISAYAQFSRDTNAQFYLSVNLGTSDVGLPVRQAQYFVDNMPRASLKAIEVGNEPDLYASNGLRSSSYTFEKYLGEFSVRQSVLQPVLPSGLKLVGPSWGSEGSLRNLPEFLKAESGNLTGVSQHWYAGIACGGRKNPPDFLLRPVAATSGAHSLAPAVALTHAKGLFFRIGEMNSIACNGEANVTDTFASALWMIDALFELANVGVDGVNVHMDTDDVYGPFLFKVNSAKAPYKYSLNVIRPEYYGLLFFQQAAPGGSKLIRTSVRNPANLKNWATIDEENTIRITTINKDEKKGRKVTLRIKNYGTGSLVRLLAPSYLAKTGITLGGVGFDGSEDGKVRGMPQTESIVPKEGVYAIEVPPTSAVLLTLKRP
jgi:Glycosyl hydrolase family 79 C-terminal beta domain